LGKLTPTLKRFSNAKADPTITGTELNYLARQGVDEGSIERDEQEMIQRIFDFDNLCAEDVMVPRNNIFALDGNKTIRETLPEILAQSHSRIPLHNGHLEEISHVVNIREILDIVFQGNLDMPLFGSGHKALFVPTTLPIDTLLEKLREQKSRLVMVVDDIGILQGLLTLEDLLEELVGEITGEKDQFPESMTEVSEGELSIDGKVELRVIEEFFDADLGGKPTDSVSSWVLAKTGYIPVRHDDQFMIDDLVVTVEQATHRAILKVRISRSDPTSD
jgi:putative hemolysin